MANVKRLPDAYYKGTNGNNYKLLNLNEIAAGEFSDDLKDVLNCLDITLAAGETLDLYGDMVGQKRNGLPDEKYRLMILNRIGRNICQGSYNNVIELLSQLFDCDKSDIILSDQTGGCGVTLKDFPLEILSNAKIDISQAVTMIKSMLPVCVRLNAEFTGNVDYSLYFAAVLLFENNYTVNSDLDITLGDYYTDENGDMLIDELENIIVDC